MLHCTIHSNPDCYHGDETFGDIHVMRFRLHKSFRSKKASFVDLKYVRALPLGAQLACRSSGTRQSSLAEAFPRLNRVLLQTIRWSFMGFVATSECGLIVYYSTTSHKSSPSLIHSSLHASCPLWCQTKPPLNAKIYRAQHHFSIYGCLLTLSFPWATSKCQET